MLGKLIKHELRSGAADVAKIYIAAGIVALLMAVFLVFDFGMAKIASSLALLAIGVIAVIITIVSIIKNFSDSMFGDRGYLTNALPVKSSALLFAKLFGAFIWLSLSYLFVYISVISVAAYLTDNTGSSLLDLFLQLLDQLDYMPSDKVLYSYVSFYIFTWLIRSFAFIMNVFFAVTLSCVRPFHKLGGIGTILYFFGAYFLVSAIGKGLSKLAELYITFQDTGAGFTFSREVVDIVTSYGGTHIALTAVYVKIIATVVFFMITTDLIDRKVNIK